MLNSTGVLVATFADTPALAFDGTNYLATWTDTRRADGTIAGSRVSTGGTALDNPRIVISTAANAQTAPAVAFDGTNYLVVWADNRAGDSTDIYAARVSPTGTILDGTGIPISVATRDQTRPCGGLRRHQLSRGVGRRSVRYDDRHLRVVGDQSRLGSGHDGDPDLGGHSATRSLLRWPSTARTTSSSGKTSVPGSTPPSTGPV